MSKRTVIYARVSGDDRGSEGCNLAGQLDMDRKYAVELGPEAHVAALFCVEREPAACHRSLVAERLVKDLGARVLHLLPSGD